MSWINSQLLTMSSILRLFMLPSVWLKSASSATLHGLSFQISSAYSLIVLSLLNFPVLRPLKIDLRVHSSGFCHSLSIYDNKKLNYSFLHFDVLFEICGDQVPVVIV